MYLNVRACVVRNLKKSVYCREDTPGKVDQSDAGTQGRRLVCAECGERHHVGHEAAPTVGGAPRLAPRVPDPGSGCTLSTNLKVTQKLSKVHPPSELAVQLWCYLVLCYFLAGSGKSVFLQYITRFGGISQSRYCFCSETRRGRCRRKR